MDTNGAIWMGSYCKKCLYANRFPKQVDKKLVACFWTDFDPEANPASKVYARVVAVDDAITWASGRNILRKAHGNKLQFDVTSNSKVMIVATWSKVTHYGGNASSTVCRIIEQLTSTCKTIEETYVSGIHISMRHND